VSDTTDPTIDQARFRQVLGHFPTGVTVITAAPEGAPPVGLAVGSFCSLSLDPPLILFCAAKSSSSWPKIEAVGSFCVNILAEDQEEVCRQFASKAEDKFAGVGYRPGHTGAPILHDVLGWIDCRMESVTDGGDHVIVVGRVLELEVAHEGKPLVFFRGGYGRFEA
jgi:3-hydroxy-9,10-secoandrosta-1,3,5(10)-triene-9,17-dione monooxygenase reductase component